MKHLKIICTIVICILSSTINAQEKKASQEAIATFEINDARDNGDDITQEVLENNARLVLYKSSDGKEIMLSNYWEKSNSQSFGRIYSITKEENPVAEFKTETFHFQWSYENTYDDIKGTSSVKLIVNHKPQVDYYELTLFTEYLDVLIYSGVIKGDLTSLLNKN
jgi:hypothetical protein